MFSGKKLKRDEINNVLKFMGLKQTIVSIEVRNTPERFTTKVIDGKYSLSPLPNGILFTLVVNLITIHMEDKRIVERKKFSQTYESFLKF